MSTKTAALAQRMSLLASETAFDVLAKAKALEADGRSVIHLEIGEPDFATPEHVVQAGIDALRRGATHYTNAAGIPELRETVARVAGGARGLDVRPTEVVVTPGAKPIIYFSLTALIEDGDEVVYPNPGFPTYESVIGFLGARPVPVPLLEEHGFVFDLDVLRRVVNERTRAIIINSPQNPTGGVLDRRSLEVIAELAQQYDCWVLSDEIYSRILYEGEHMSIAALPNMRQRTVVLDGFSKTFAMTGWRLGYGIMPELLAEAVGRLMLNCNSCTAAFTQYAGIAALEGPQNAVEAMTAEFRRRREAIISGLNAIPSISCRWPAGAFYAFPNISRLGLRSQAFADRLLQDYGVATLAGPGFGSYGEGYLRLSYANSLENLLEALRRIRQAVADL